MFSRRASVLCLPMILLTAGALGGGGIPNWPAPSTWTPPRGGGSGGVRLLAETNPLPFLAVTPCRGADTRAGAGFAGQYGPPSLGGSSTRTFMIEGTCGIPASAAAVSFNFTVTNNPSFGDIRVYPAGGSVLVSTLNWGPNTGNVANAAVVPLSAGGAITVQVDGPGPLDLLYDINGYYAATSAANQLAPGESFSLFGNVTGSTAGVLHVQNTNQSGVARGGYFRCDSGVDGSAGLVGFENAVSGAVSGVLGQTASTSFGGSAGVRGVDGSGSGLQPSVSVLSAGVRGESTSGFGVLGLSKATGVSGSKLDSTGTPIAGGCLGCGGAATLGVYGESSLTGGVGVYGMSGPGGYGVFSLGNLAASGTKAFIEPHPTDPSKVIRYVSLEGPEAGTYFRGTEQTSDGEAFIEVPESFRIVTDEEGLTVQLTPVGDLATMAVISQDLKQVRVRASKEVRFHYLVQGVRRAFKDFRPIAEGREFVPGTPSDALPGSLTEEAKRRLIANGTYNPDGTVNLETAKALGWDKAWAEKGGEKPQR